jgi:ppGpp synthetase/RelA/SpoT-type nucleotidyltranferase
VRDAFELAYKGHDGQFREKPTGGGTTLPYIVHPVGVALLAYELFDVESPPDDRSTVVAAALTHDLLEDTNVTSDHLRKTTNQRTMEIVQALTKPAISESLSRQSRNSLLITQIAAAGRTASFLKVCDLLHNISRPSNTPAKLLRKAIERGKSSYGVLFEQGGLSPQLRETFRRRIAVAEMELSQLSSNSSSTPPSSVEEVLEQCASLGTHKVLELHDIVEALKSLTGASIAMTDTVKQFVGTIFQSPNSNASKKEAELAKTALLSGCLELGAVPQKVRSEELLSLSTVLCAPLELDDQRDLFLFLGFTDRPAEIWRTGRLLRIVLIYLTDRLRNMMRNRKVSLNNAILRYGLDLSADELAIVNYQEAQLKSLGALLEWAEFSRSQLLSALRFTFARSEWSGEIEDIESRSKTPHSILRKMARREFESHFDLEDIVGFRIVCTNAKQCNRIAETVVKFLNAATGFSSKLSIAADDPPTQKSVGTSSGYRAIHITFAIRPQGTESSFRIGCEVQIRTLYQDAWAKASHRLFYGEHKSQNDGLRNKLKRLSEISKEADDLLE